MSEGIVKFKQDFIETIPIKTAATTYDFLDHAPKKDKKWSLGNLFRRKKKEESESSSDDEVKRKNLVNKKKRRNDKRKKNLGFDHIVVAKSRGSYIVTNGVEDVGILSDPSGGFSSYVGRPLPRIPVDENKNDYGVDSITRKGKRERTKARAIARRDSLRQGSSSDEDSQRSYSSARFRSDESLSRARDGSMSRRSRTARTERYIKRLSKDDESILNREALQRQTRENWHLKLPEDLSRYGRSASKSPILSTTPKSAECYINSAPLSQPTYSGLFTIPPSHSNHNKFRTSNPQLSNPTPRQEARSFNNRSISCEANIHNQQETIIHAQLPIAKPNRFRNLSLIEQPRLIKQPPPPPPRDPRRLVQIDTRPMSFCSQRRNNENLFQPSYRTVSEDHIPTEPKQSLSPRPSSVTNENRRHTPESTDKFQYLTEKKARSRKPIFIQSQESIKSPQMFTAETHVQTKVYLPSAIATENRNPSPFKPISSANSNDSIAHEINRKSANLEEALDELEAIYKSLHLGDEDLLERAEQREMSIASKKLIETKAESYPSWGVIPRGAISDSSFTYEPFDSVDSPKKKRYLKKSHTLDRKNDDMAYRKLHKERANTINNSQSVVSNVSYLLASPVHGMQDETESVPDENNHEPDVTLDDVVYRTIKHANNSLKVIDPQPPFGIPIGPITPAPNSDYLHAAPEPIPRYSFKLKNIPDVVKDDLAFRNLRKDFNKEPALENNSSLKKKRAVRSLSANLMNIKENNNVENEFKKTTLTDIADAMEIARQILKDKDSRINSTRRAFLSDSETKNMKFASENGADNISESRMNFLNDMRNEKVKDSSFEDLLTALAVEARETSDRITKELDELDIKKQQSNELEIDSKQELNKRLEEIDEVSEHARLCEKLLECVVKTEEVEDIESEFPKVVANVVTTRVDEEICDPVHIEVHSVSDHDYENLGSDAEFDKAIPLIDEDVAGSRSPFEEHREELIASFKGLGKLDNRDFSSEDEEGVV
ncbi:PREDICTED: uncharacterized protein LOC108563406 isoform X2 [Nicrophorus vespilloides]|nr:PREDICTED: uncharacterized protein LOC108563406 isoform X2 [Nicrophorus vespilloides]XP_017777560.1 PREDICTED: uncharacterized protein LOC108563406 isoform X2 [Nicrophorus vespilloides]